MIEPVHQRHGADPPGTVPDMNERISRRRFSTLAPVLVMASFGLASLHLEAAEMQVGRYSVLRTLPTVEQIDPLAVRVTVRFPESVQTIGQAVQHLLRDSGYRMADSSTGASAILLEMPLPGVQRSLGPVALRQALAVLGGPAFRLVQDPLHRLVAFERCPNPDPPPEFTGDLAGDSGHPVRPAGDNAWGR